MKNFLRIQPEEWKKERELGQFSFIIKRAIIFASMLLPLMLINDYLFRSESVEFRIGPTVIFSIGMSVLAGVTEWFNLEFRYRKSVRKSRKTFKK